MLDAVDGGGEATFWVRFKEQADLSDAAEIDEWADRGAEVVERLRSAADASQAAVRAKLDASDTPYVAYWVSNALQVTGDEATVRDLADEPSVAAILAPVHYAVPEPVGGPDRTGVDAVEWGIARINADDVWSQFGVRGEGIVVANIDTGVQFDHPALVGAVPRQPRRRHVRPQLQLVRPVRHLRQPRAVRQPRARHPHDGHDGRRRRRRQPDRRRARATLDRAPRGARPPTAPTPPCCRRRSGSSLPPTSPAPTRGPTCAPTS